MVNKNVSFFYYVNFILMMQPSVGMFHEKRKQLIGRGVHFYHFRGFVLCNIKQLQFHQIKKQAHRGTVQQVFYTPMLSFLKIDALVGFICVAQHFSLLQWLHCHFWWFLVKIIFTQIILCIMVFNLGNLARALFIFVAMFLPGYYEEVTFVLSKKHLTIV